MIGNDREYPETEPLDLDDAIEYLQIQISKFSSPYYPDPSPQIIYHRRFLEMAVEALEEKKERDGVDLSEEKDL